MQQVASGVNKIINAQKQEDIEKLTKLRTDQIEAEEKRDRMLKLHGKNSRQFISATMALTNRTKLYNAAVEEGSKVSADVAKKMLAEQVVRMSLGKGATKFKVEID